jgi:two-component system sensor histidine kinase BaeS
VRKRLTQAFFGVICLTLGLVYLFIQNSSGLVLQNSFRTTFQIEIQPLVPKLMAYYESHNQSWDGVDDLLLSPSEAANAGESINRNPHNDLVLVDASGKILAPKNAPLFGMNQDYLSLESALPIEFKGSTIGYLSSTIMLANLPNSVLAEFNLLFSRFILIALVASGIIAMFYAILVTNTVVQPIAEMTKTVKEMAQGRLDLRVNPQKYGYSNLVTLAESINYLTDSIEKVRIQRRQTLSDIAHELRTPLAVQKSYLEAMEDEVIPFSTDSIKTLQEQNTLLTRLVNDLRLLSVAEFGELHPVLRQMDLTLTLVSVLEQFLPNLAEAKLTINLLAPEPHPIILGDQDRIEQIINNLMQNERRYAPPGSNLDVACYQCDHQALLSIRDYGIGVPKEELESIFGRFYRTSPGIRSEAGGSGLGLTIARKLAEAHGGTLTASMPVGEGVVFTLILPLAFEPIKLPKRRGKSKKIRFF